MGSNKMDKGTMSEHTNRNLNGISKSTIYK